MYHRDPRGIPTRDEEQELGRRVQAGDEDAWRELVERNMPLVFNLARHFVAPGKPVDDAAQAGMLGLMRAARDYNPDEHDNARFSTFAVYWIRRTLCDHANNDTVIRRPKSAVMLLIADPETLTDRQRDTRKAADVASPWPTSLHMLTESDSEGGLPGRDEPVIDRLIRDEELDLLRDAMNQLDERSRDILERRIHGATLTEVGLGYGFTREWVRKIEEQAIKKLADLMGTPRTRCRSLASNGRTY